MRSCRFTDPKGHTFPDTKEADFHSQNERVRLDTAIGDAEFNRRVVSLVPK
jgi:hypothetical protein